MPCKCDFCLVIVAVGLDVRQALTVARRTRVMTKRMRKMRIPGMPQTSVTVSYLDRDNSELCADVYVAPSVILDLVRVMSGPLETWVAVLAVCCTIEICCYCLYLCMYQNSFLRVGCI